MIENVVGVFGLPLAIAPNFLVNSKDYIVPMVVEEPSIVAGVSGAAKLVRQSGGFKVSSADPVLIGQILLVDIDAERVKQAAESLTSEGYFVSSHCCSCFCSFLNLNFF